MMVDFRMKISNTINNFKKFVGKNNFIKPVHTKKKLNITAAISFQHLKDANWKFCVIFIALVLKYHLYILLNSETGIFE